MRAGEDILEIRGVNKAFGGLQAVDNVSFVMEPGVVTSMIGPNGAGKTTLFNVITGHLQADTGKVIFKGEDITNLAPHTINRKGIARSFQIVNIFPQFTVLENVQTSIISRIGKGSSPFGQARSMVREEAIEILDRVGLSEQTETIAGTLAYGDQRIMEIAIALGSQPELLLLDEPTAGMAPEETFATVDVIKKLAADRELTILLVEHDMEVIFSVSETIVVLHDGKMLAMGRPEEVRKNEDVQKVYLGEEIE